MAIRRVVCIPISAATEHEKHGSRNFDQFWLDNTEHQALVVSCALGVVGAKFATCDCLAIIDNQ